MEKSRQYLLAFLLIATFVAVLKSDFSLCSWEYCGPNHVAKTAAYFAADRSDVPPLLLRSRQCANFLQTKSYWHEDYTPGIPFYRPLSLTWYWCEYHLLSPKHFERWTTVSIVLDLVFCVLLAILIRLLTGSLAAGIITIFFFAGMVCSPLIGLAANAMSVTLNSPAFYSIKEWKDQPTILSDCAMLCAFIFAIRSSWTAGLISAVISILFKESGWITFLLTFLFLRHIGRLRDIPRWVYAGVVVAMLIPILARYMSGMGLIGGYRVGQNYEWKVRYINGVCGTFLNGPLHGWWLESLLGISIYALFVKTKLPIVGKVIAAAAAFAIFGMLISVFNSIPLVLSVSRIMDPSEGLPYVGQGLIFAWGIKSLVQYPEMGKTAVFLWLISLIAALPYVAALQVNTHALNMCFALQASVAGIAVVCMGRSTYETASRLFQQLPAPRELVR